MTALMKAPCWMCDGARYVETGYQYESNVSTTNRCGICAGTGFVTVEKPTEDDAK